MENIFVNWKLKFDWKFFFSRWIENIVIIYSKLIFGQINFFFLRSYHTYIQFHKESKTLEISKINTYTFLAIPKLCQNHNGEVFFISICVNYFTASSFNLKYLLKEIVPPKRYIAEAVFKMLYLWNDLSFFF